MFSSQRPWPLDHEEQYKCFNIYLILKYAYAYMRNMCWNIYAGVLVG